MRGRIILRIIVSIIIVLICVVLLARRGNAISTKFAEWTTMHLPVREYEKLLNVDSNTGQVKLLQ